jgi:hypothetical protein
MMKWQTAVVILKNVNTAILCMHVQIAALRNAAAGTIFIIDNS